MELPLGEQKFLADQLRNDYKTAKADNHTSNTNKLLVSINEHLEKAAAREQKLDKIEERLGTLEWAVARIPRLEDALHTQQIDITAWKEQSTQQHDKLLHMVQDLAKTVKGKQE